MFRKTLCFILSLALIISAAPIAVLAADDVVIEFSSASMDEPYKLAPSAWTGIRDFEVVLDESTTGASSRLTSNKIPEFENKKILQAGMRANGNAVWVKAVKNREPYKAVLTIQASVPNAGWYGIKLLGGVSQYGSDYYIYVNDQYAGFYSFYTTDTSAHCLAGEEKTLNTLYLTPDENGKVKIKFCVAATHYSSAYAFLYKLTLSPISGDVSVSGIESSIPDEMKLGESAELSTKVRMSDGTLRSSNGYKVDASADADNSLAVALGGSNISLTKTSSDVAVDGEYTASLSADAVGDAKITTSAKVDGVEYTDKKYVWVLNADGTAPSFDIRFGQETLSFTDKTVPSEDWVTDGFDLVLDKTTTYQCRRFGKVDAGEFGTVGLNVLQLRSGSYSAWYNQDIGSDSRRNNMFTIRKNMPAAGYYDLEFRGFKWYAGGQFSVYVDGKYAGDVNCYDKASESITFGEAQPLNTLYLPKGAVEISFCSRKAYYDTPNLIPYYLKFTPSSEYSVSEVESAIPGTLENGASIDLTASAKMSDGTLRRFGYLLNEKTKTDSANIIKVSSSDNSVVSVSDVVCVEPQISKDLTQVIDPAVTKYKLTALKSGNADITVTAVVDGKEKSKTVNVTVPSTDPSESAPVAKFMVTSVGANAEITTNIAGYTKGNIADVDLGTKVSVTAGDVSGYTFKYWKTNSGYVSSDKAYTFTMGSNTALFAVYEQDGVSDGIKVEFFNGNRELIETRTAEKGAPLSDVGFPSDPTMTGYVFEKWSLDGSTVINKDTQVVAIYSDEGTAVNGLVVDGEAKSDARYGKLYTAIAEDMRGGKPFRYWARNSKCVSFDKTYSFYAWDNASIDPVYSDDTSEVLPSVVLDANGSGYMLEYDVPEGFTKIEAGIIFGGSASITVDKCYSKAVSRRDSAHGQFTAKPSGTGVETYARGYVIYMSGAEYRVIYSD